MTDDAYWALRDAVNLARFQGIRKVDALRGALLQKGWPEQTVSEAILAWANYERSKE